MRAALALNGLGKVSLASYSALKSAPPNFPFPGDKYLAKKIYGKLLLTQV